MIREFWVENYLSVSGRQGVSFVSKKGDGTITARIGKEDLNKIGIFFGPNASGKSNMLFAVQNIFDLLCQPRSSEKIHVLTKSPFALTADAPTRMFISFYADGIRYDYEISYNRNHILSEEMHYYPNNARALVYSREFVEAGLQANIRYGQSLNISGNDKISLSANTLNNHSLLSTLGKINLKAPVDVLSPLYSWIVGHMHEVDGDEKEQSFIDFLKNVRENDELYRFFLKLLDKADVNISGFEIVLSDNFLDPDVRQRILENDSMPFSLKKKLLEEKREDVVFTNKSGGGEFSVPIGLQSTGTLTFLNNLRFLQKLTQETHVYMLDEIERNMHYELLRFFITYFLLNSGQSQLIFSSHELMLLKEDFLNCNRSAVFMVDKDSETASSRYRRADTIDMPSDMDLYDAYIAGWYGSRPVLKSPLENY